MLKDYQKYNPKKLLCSEDGWMGVEAALPIAYRNKNVLYNDDKCKLHSTIKLFSFRH